MKWSSVIVPCRLFESNHNSSKFVSSCIPTGISPDSLLLLSLSMSKLLNCSSRSGRLPLRLLQSNSWNSSVGNLWNRSSMSPLMKLSDSWSSSSFFSFLKVDGTMPEKLFLLRLNNWMEVKFPTSSGIGPWIPQLLRSRYVSIGRSICTSCRFTTSVIRSHSIVEFLHWRFGGCALPLPNDQSKDSHWSLNFIDGKHALSVCHYTPSGYSTYWLDFDEWNGWKVLKMGHQRGN